MQPLISTVNKKILVGHNKIKGLSVKFFTAPFYIFSSFFFFSYFFIFHFDFLEILKNHKKGSVKNFVDLKIFI